MKNYSLLSEYDLNVELVKACGRGDLDLAKYLINSKELPYNAVIKFNKWEPIKLATSLGQLEIVKHYLDDIQNEYPNIVFNVACRHGQLEILKHLFTTSEFVSDRRNLSIVGSPLAAYHGHVNVLEYFVTFPEFIGLGETKKTHYEDLFVNVCGEGYINVIEYFLNHKDFLDSVNLSDLAYLGFYRACENDQMEVLNHFVFHLNMEFNEHIKDYLTEKNRDDIKELFHKRELNKQLESDLPKNTSANTKIKV